MRSGSPPAPDTAALELRDVAVVVPVGPGDEAWRGLALDLRALPPEAEVVFAATEPVREPPAGARWVVAPRGRALQMNAGARATRRPFLWFLHADARFAADTLPSLARALAAAPAALHYFELDFLDDGPALVRLNALGARLRSRWGGMPFGDQGLCLRRDLWERLGGFPGDAPYGEDHLLVWRARQAGARLRPTGGVLRTSARRYREQGWLATTARHLRLTAVQAWPEWVRLLRERATAPRG
ncbi:MAG TPA: hypothetical protein VFL93_16265 [Longimicrobiaceae bacterium]|nr:hypothetical protein [Longimicrobiaceae bacterium]